MPSKSDIEAGRAFVRLFLKNDMSKQLARALQSAGPQLKSFGRGIMTGGAGLTATGGGILAPLVASIKSFADQGDVLDKMAQRTGIAGSALAEFSFAAEQSGSSLGDFENGLRRMQRSIADAERGLTTAIDGLEMVGLSVKQLRGLSPEDQFQAIADGMAAIVDPSKKAAAAQMLFGRSGTQLLPMLNGLRDLRGEARGLGIVPTQEEIQNAAKVTDAINRVVRVLKATLFDVGASLVRPILQFLEVAKKIGLTVKDWAKANAGLIMTVAGVGAAIMAAGVAITALGAVVFSAGVALSAVGTIVGALLSPLGLVVAAVVGATVAFFRWTESGQAAFQYLSTSFGVLLSWFQEVFGAISAAMAAGDMQLAAEVMWAGIKVAWTKGMYWLKKAWSEVAFAVLDTSAFLWDAMVDGFWGAIDKIVDSWKWLEESFAKGIGWVLAKLQGLDPDEVMANVGQDYDRQQAGRDAGREARDKANQDATDARYAAIEEARRESQTGAEDELEKARKKLADAISRANGKAITAPEVEPIGTGKGSAVALPGGGVGSGPSRGVSLTATYSAAAARISGYGGGGPEEKMSRGIAAIDKNTERMNALMERFLAGWQVG